MNTAANPLTLTYFRFLAGYDPLSAPNIKAAFWDEENREEERETQHEKGAIQI